MVGFGIRRESDGGPLRREPVGLVATAGAGCRKSAQHSWLDGSSALVCEKSLFAVIPNEVRNLSGFECKEKKGFLGTQRASE
jgi:hypothetical protein